MRTKTVIIAILAVAGLLALFNAAFTVNEAQQAIVLQLGQHVRTIKDEPGLHFKVPFVQNVVYYEDRVLDAEPQGQQAILADNKRLEVDTFVRYRITDPLRFYQALSTEEAANQRIGGFVNSTLKNVLGTQTMQAVLSKERAGIMTEIRRQVNDQSKPLGVEIVDLRIRRADLPEQTSQSTFARMKSEREREAADARAQGFEQAQQIRASAERERTILVAEAQREAQVLRGQGDEQAIRILGEAYGRDAEFFTFYRTLQAYRKTFGDKSTTMVLSPDGEFFRFFNPRPQAPGGQASPPAPGAAATTASGQ